METPGAFISAVQAVGPFPPPDIDKFWEVWLRRATGKQVPRYVLAVLMQAYSGCYVAVRMFGGVSGVVADHCIRQFIPDRLLFPTKDSADPLAPLVEWLRSNQGYVEDPIEITHEPETAR